MADLSKRCALGARALAALWVTMSAAPVMAQAVESPPPPPRLDERVITHAKTSNSAGYALPGQGCQILQVDAGESFTLMTVSPGHVLTIEAINGAMCNFGMRPGWPDPVRLHGVSPEPGKAALLRLPEPGYYSVRVFSPDMPDGSPVGILTTPLHTTATP